MKKLKTLVATIILGALGGAFWEWVLKPLFIFIYDRIIMYSLHLFSDSFYLKVAKSIDSPASLTFYYILMTVAILILLPPKFFSVLLHGESRNKTDAFLNTITRLACFLIIMFNMFTTLIANQTARETLRNIEIVAPYVSDIEYKTLKSDFYRINSKDDYLDLTNNIKLIMNENDLTE